MNDTMSRSAKELQKDTGFGRGISDATTADAPELEDLELEDDEEPSKKSLSCHWPRAASKPLS